MGLCAKVRVKATIITTDGRRFVGYNDVESPQATCPRGNLPSGVGYDLCQSVCHQAAHAEVAAIYAAGLDACGSTLFLEGHTACCPACLSACNAAGIAKIVIGAPPAIFC